MKIIMFEGPSTSGKTTLANLLIKKLQKAGRKAVLIDENQTLMPVLNTPETKIHLDHLTKVLEGFTKKDYDFVIIDRFHLTAAAVCSSKVSDFKPIEDELLKYDPIIIFLKVDEEKLGPRIFKAMEHREDSWKEHVAKKGNEEQIESWYLKTQENLLEGLKNSKIKSKIVNVTDSNYEQISDDLKMELM